MSKTTPELSLVIPFKNERVCLDLLLRRIQQSLSLIQVSYELVLVDDGSSDGSWELISSGAFNHLPLRAISLSRNFGKESAIRVGLRESRGRATVVLDADLQHPPELLPAMYAAWKNHGFLVVEAVRRVGPKRSWLNAAGSWLFYTTLSKLAGIPLANATDFKLLDRQVVQQICQLPERITFFRGMVTWLGYATHQVEFDVPPRPAGQTRWSLWRLTTLAIDGITGFTTLPLRMVTLFSMFFILASGLLILQTLYNYFMGNAVEGFATVIICILLVGGVVTGSLGIIGEYLARVYEEIKSRPSYIIRRRYSAQQMESSEWTEL